MVITPDLKKRTGATANEVEERTARRARRRGRGRKGAFRRRVMAHRKRKRKVARKMLRKVGYGKRLVGALGGIKTVRFTVKNLKRAKKVVKWTARGIRAVGVASGAVSFGAGAVIGAGLAYGVEKVAGAVIDTGMAGFDAYINSGRSMENIGANLEFQMVGDAANTARADMQTRQALASNPHIAEIVGREGKANSQVNKIFSELKKLRVKELRGEAMFMRDKRFQSMSDLDIIIHKISDELRGTISSEAVDRLVDAYQARQGQAVERGGR